MAKTVERALKRTEKTLDQIERKLDKLQSSPLKGTPAWSDAAARADADIRRRCQAVAEQHASLTPGDPGVADQIARREGLEARLDALLADLNAGAAEADALAAEWEALRGSPDYARDEGEVSGFESLEAFWFRLGDRRFADASPADYEATLGLVESWSALRARHAALEARYERFGRHANSIRTHLASARQAFERCEATLDRARELGLAHLVELGRALATQTQEALAMKRQAEAAGRSFSLGLALLAPECGAQRAARQLERTATYLAALDPEHRDAFQGAATPPLEAFAATLDEVRAEILRSRSLPADDYAGADRAELEAFAREAARGRLHGGELLAVRLAGDWQRRQATRWDPSNQALEALDRSSLLGWLLVAHDEEQVLVRQIDLERDHQRGDALGLSGDFQDHPAPRLDQLLPRALLPE